MDAGIIPMRNLLIVCAIYEELLPLLKYKPLSFAYNKEIRAYQSQIDPSIFACTIAPRCKKKKELGAILKKINPHHIINAGLVGALEHSSKPKIGSNIQIKGIYASKDLQKNDLDTSFHANDFNTFLLPQKAHKYNIQRYNQKKYNQKIKKCYKLLCVSKPIFASQEKKQCSQEYSTAYCDMESFPLLIFLQNYAEQKYKEKSEEEEKIKLSFVKVIGDTPKKAYLFQKEALLRQWSRTTACIKISILLRNLFILPQILLLLYYKSKALRALRNTTLATIAQEKLNT